MVLAVGGAIAWTQLGPAPTARAAAVAARAPVQSDGWLGFGPRSAPVGVVLYPGARVAAAAYAPVARDLSRAGDAFVAVVDMPLDVALLRVDAADAVRDAVPGIDRWVVGGHSLGGVATARYVADPATDARARSMIVDASAGVIAAAGT